MAALRAKVVKLLTDIGIGIGIVGISVGAAASVIGLTIATFGAITAFQALIAWGVWNLTAPLFDLVPAAYKHFDFLQVWGAVAILHIVGGLLFGTLVRKESR